MIAYEHLHRYAHTAQFLKGKRVLDLASREGYGARLLAGTAESVVGVDADEAVVRQAAQKHNQANLKFIAGSVTGVPIADDHSFDAIVCFDAIEPTTDECRLFKEVKRLLKEDGFFIVSAPGKSAGAAVEQENPFRVKEFTADEFRAMLAPHFKHVQFFGQSVYTISTIESSGLDGHDGHATGPDLPSTGKGVPLYLIAITSDSRTIGIDGSVRIDETHGLLADREKTIRRLLDAKAYQDETLKRQATQFGEWQQTIASLQEAFAWHKSQINSLNKSRAYLESEISELRQTLASDKEALKWRASQVEEFERIVASKDEALEWRASQIDDLHRAHEYVVREHALQIENLQREMTGRVDLVTKELEATHASPGWKFILRVRSIRDGLMPAGSLRHRMYERVMRLARR
jgi:SAM-dependent methyltransferase